MGGTLWLVGLMGAGKSTLGVELARRLGHRFVDTDREVVRAAGADVPAIFAAEGEAGFRKREREAIEAVAGARAVVALGGGAIAQPNAAARLAETGTVVYLRASPESLLERVGEDAERPLLAGLDRAGRLERLRELLRARAPHYETAAIVVDTDGRSPAEVADLLLVRLAREGG